MTTQTELSGAAPDQGSLLDLGPIRRARRITRDEVYRTADELLVAGHRPTIDRVRVKLGRGSPNTINDYLDAWWAKLGSRLRDLPDRQFPALPERVATTLQQLWNEALDGAHEALQHTLAAREATLSGRDSELAQREARLVDQERAAAGRNAALEEALALTRAQLTEANQRATTLEAALRDRDADLKQSQLRLDRLESDRSELAQRLETERARLEERHAKTEGRWLTEVDRARQSLKEGEQRVKELQAKVTELRAQRERATTEAADRRAEVQTLLAVRAQLEERVRLLSQSGGTPRSPRKPRRAPKAAGARRPSSSVRKS